MCTIPLSVLLLTALCLPLPVARGEEPPDPGVEIVAGPRRKTPGFFARPHENSAAEQIDYARRLEKEGYRRSASREYDSLVHEWHDSPEAVLAQMAYARLLEERGLYKRAFDEYQYLMDFFPGGFSHEDVLQAQFRIANLIRTERHLNMFHLGGYTTPERALPLFEKIAENAPGWIRTAETLFYIGMIHQEREDYDEAITAYVRLMQDYPESPWAVEATFFRAECMYLVAQAATRDEDLCRRALSALASFIADYPDSAHIDNADGYRQELSRRMSEMHFARAAFYESKPGKTKAAMAAYANFRRRFPFTDLAREATERIEALKEEMEGENEQE